MREQTNESDCHNEGTALRLRQNDLNRWRSETSESRPVLHSTQLDRRKQPAERKVM